MASSRPARVGDVGFREPELAPDLHRSSVGHDLPWAPRREELDAELHRHVTPTRLQDGPDGQSHRRVRERGEDPSVHQALQVEVLRAGLERDLHPAGGRVDQLHTRPTVELAALQTISETLDQRFVLVHPQTPPAA